MNVLITGAFSGLGYSYAKKLSKRGHIVYVGVENKKQQEVLEEKIRNEKIILFPVVINLLQEETFYNISSLGLDVIILQAGIGEGGSIYEIDMDRFEETYRVNFFGNIKLIKVFLDYIVKTNKKGKIIITSSLAAFLPLPYLSSYTTSKIGLYLLSKTLRLELNYQKIPVKVSMILPGAYATGFNDVFIDNKEKNIILKEKAYKMTEYQKIFFALSESLNYDSISNKVVKVVENDHFTFIASAPFFQKVVVKLYRLIDALLEL